MRGLALLFAVAVLAAAVVVAVPLRGTSQHQLNAESRVTPLHAAFGTTPLETALTPSRAWYGHGGFMGFGGALVSDAKWMAIMDALMPKVAAAIVKKPDVKAMIKGLENNPVCAAFGYSNFKALNHPIVNQPFEWDSFFTPAATAADPQVEKMLVAHGSPLELFKESTWKTNSYGAVERTAATELGGVTAAQWRDIFVNAMRLSSGAAALPTVSWADFGALFPGGKFRVVLDVKTGITQATAPFLAAVVAEWAKRSVEVVGVGSFNYNQNTGISALTGGKTAEVWFFHGLVDAGVPIVHQPQLFDIYKSDPAKLKGKTVLFNAGFLVRYQRTGVNWFGFGKNTKQSSYVIDAVALAKLKEMRAAIPTLTIGAYVQEYDIDHHALAVLNAMFNAESGVFNAGFAWGGSSVSWYSDIKPSATDATTGTNGQGLFAKINYL